MITFKKNKFIRSADNVRHIPTFRNTFPKLTQFTVILIYHRNTNIGLSSTISKNNTAFKKKTYNKGYVGNVSQNSD